MVSWRDSGFAWLYGVLKRQWFCLCEICKNALFLVNGLDKKSISRKLTSSNHKWAGCEVLMRRCWKMHVREMREVLFLHEDFNVESIADSDSENSNTSYSDCDYNQQTAIAAFYEWACEGTKLKQMLFKESIDIATRKFTSTMTTLKHHIHVKRVQFNQYSSIKSNLGPCSCWVQWALWRQTSAWDTEAPTSVIRNSVYLPKVATLDILKITL